jgi:hypothetical protein
MTTSKRFSRQEVRLQMNMALDNALSSPEQDVLDEHLAVSHQDAAFFENMHSVDRLFASEPLIHAPPNFAANLMAAISAGKAPQPVQHRTDLRAVSGLVLATAMLLPVFLLVMSYIHQLLTDPVAFNTLAHRIMWIFNIVVGTLSSLLEVIVEHTSGNLVAIWALFSAAMVGVVWTGYNRVFSSRKELIVYRIPVQVY